MPGVVHCQAFLQIMRYACVVVHAGGDITKNVDVVEMRGRRVYLVFTVCNVPWWFARFRTSAVAPSELWRDKRFSVAASLFYFALLHKKVGLANPKACQAEVFSPKKRRLEHRELESLTCCVRCNRSTN